MLLLPEDELVANVKNTFLEATPKAQVSQKRCASAPGRLRTLHQDVSAVRGAECGLNRQRVRRSRQRPPKHIRDRLKVSAATNPSKGAATHLSQEPFARPISIAVIAAAFATCSPLEDTCAEDTCTVARSAFAHGSPLEDTCIVADIKCASARDGAKKKLRPPKHIRRRQEQRRLRAQQLGFCN
eukprot:gnl/TRDRNA2_/TRDRNA2_68702_c0_seq1.p1 gnl/TRDRNA2_/TRDRNA2_68702_c0~~gnl/TRDRNA2_/TRDRNA2_68702_c0_seq1.p1  ORF type:complete len:184 (+),score=25.66 gnl/TRDRNA2_/TRDRNA2_68702_c0_seq1:77-628(+)